ncbi:hypothetical protein BAUCODRAFT_35629 [Baudoinia panamericana UAMH 10762]|uniref:Glycosyltransferase family 69 protein n=1 Tax=Baudoinia panamericana (strain UAMH 10762) TaxID=717646 RepID=M2N5U4_BAUPA|nr:uncharacterized protein BAUCODRAFT_35629 [Baudoinia panamericana UAMH 10762]EMC94409.1 hypothetical protein BAUCODRAFT_35629 [Baudoinia panamericana UAMH 10762]
MAVISSSKPSLLTAILATLAILIALKSFVHIEPIQELNMSLARSLGLHRNRDLVLYSFFETPEATQNFNFFLRHGLHAEADFILMINGGHSMDLATLRYLPNVRIIERENRCFDLGGLHEIFTNEPHLAKRYKRFMFLNASLRGPFFPPWANDICWSDAYWNKLDARTKIVGMTWNCANNIPLPPHVQSMILAFDQRTLNEILLPRMKCYESMDSAIRDGETAMTSWVLDAGGGAYAMESRFQAHAGESGRNTTAFLDWCVGTPSNDVLHTGLWEGSSMHPYETIFTKTNRDWDERDRKTIDLLTEHVDLSGYSSYDSCR